MAFMGVFDKKYTREELTQNFIKHEKEFLDVITYFKANVPQKNDYSFSFWQNGKYVSLYLYPHVISPENKIVGAGDVKVNSPKLDSALQILGWNRDTLKLLADKLKKTNCNFIGNVGFNENIRLSPHQTGWGSFTYVVLNKPIIDSLVHIHGIPLGTDSFGVRVLLNYSSAL